MDFSDEGVFKYLYEKDNNNDEEQFVNEDKLYKQIKNALIMQVIEQTTLKDYEPIQILPMEKLKLTLTNFISLLDDLLYVGLKICIRVPVYIKDYGYKDIQYIYDGSEYHKSKIRSDTLVFILLR